MGIYIPNMKKPKGCYECPIAKSYLDCLMEKKYVCPIGHTDDCPLIEIDQEDEEAVLFLARMRKAMREGKSLREFLDGERRDDETQP